MLPHLIMTIILPKSSRGPSFLLSLVIIFPQLLLAQQQFKPSPTTSAWIVLGNATSKSVPSCSDLCVQVYRLAFGDPATLQNSSVVLYPCTGLSVNEFWQYNETSNAIQFQYQNTTWCMAGTNDSSLATNMVLSSCNSSEVRQRWSWDAGNMTFSMVDRSGHALYMSGSHMYNQTFNNTDPSVFPLYLDSGPNQDNILQFTQMPFSDPLAIAPAQRRSHTNLVDNGGFETCWLKPLQGSAYPLSSIDVIPLCSWVVLNGVVDYVPMEMWLPQEGNYSIHLQKNGSVRQILPTRNGSTYNLTFHMAGDPTTGCGDPNKSLRVDLLHTNVSTQNFSFNVQGNTKTSMGWKATDPILFMAQADRVNLTFTSILRDNSACGPAIDNVIVQEIQAAPSSPNFPPNPSSKPWKVNLYACAAVTVFAIVILVPGLQRRRMRFRREKRQPNVEVTKGLKRRIHALALFSDEPVKEFTWKELETATDDFTKVVDEGGFSTVYRADFEDGTLGAVKVEKSTSRSGLALRQELAVLLRLRHAHLVNLIGFCTERDEYAIVSEFMPNGNLHKRLHCCSPQDVLPWRTRMAIAQQIALALEYLHEVCRPSVVHSDIKPANILLDENDCAKLCDFGFSKTGPNTRSTFHSKAVSVKGSFGYLDPQFYKRGILSKKSDIYSFGVVLLELLTGRLVFDFESAEFLTEFAARFLGDPAMVLEMVDPNLPSGSYVMNDFLCISRIAEMCIREEGMQRPSMTEVVMLMRTELSVQHF